MSLNSFCTLVTVQYFTQHTNYADTLSYSVLITLYVYLNINFIGYKVKVEKLLRLDPAIKYLVK